MARIANPLKDFNFDIRVSVPFFNSFTVQECNTPDQKIDQVEHGETNHLVKTGGQVKYSNAKFKGIIDAQGPIDWVWDWFRTVQNVQQGGGAIPQVYKKTLTVEHFDVDGFTVIKTELWEGVWPCNLQGKNLKRIGSANVMDEYELSVDKVTLQ